VPGIDGNQHRDWLVSLKHVAERLDVSIRTVYRLIAAGILPGPVKVRGASRLWASDVERYLTRLKRGWRG